LQTGAFEDCQQGIILPDENKGRCRLIDYEIEKASMGDTAGGKSIKFSFMFVMTHQEVTKPRISIYSLMSFLKNSA